jgi:hypothetical protein
MDHPKAKFVVHAIVMTIKVLARREAISSNFTLVPCMLCFPALIALLRRLPTVYSRGTPATFASPLAHHILIFVRSGWAHGAQTRSRTAERGGSRKFSQFRFTRRAHPGHV